MAVPAQRLERTRPRRVYYPTSDGKPMAETQKHVNLMIYAISALTVHFAEQPDVYVAGNNFIFYEEGNPKARISPDTYVVFGVGNQVRDSYMAWKEGGKLPDVVFEFTSKKTRREDTHTKRPLYERVLRVPEYFLFDPTGDYLNPRLQGYRLTGGNYVSLELRDNRLRSERLNLDIVMEGDRLRLYDPAKGRFLPTLQEEAERAEIEAQRAAMAFRRAEAEARKRSEAEAEIERLRAELAALKRTETPEHPNI
jgi:Uma2 family endonuclease